MSGQLSRKDKGQSQICLNGTATDEIYNSLDCCYVSCDGIFTYIGSSFAPLTIEGAYALAGWGKVTEE